ncbi:MAG TPA: efflux RND transporter periplasmic adaptor subunit [Candidatus Dormibacteraeota bacterium]|nr:efflux RND transporter periplasmic adaptor subunit [Candidatus Dormibacteraeota bacterium]
MTQHEKKYLVTGLTLGLMLALVAYAAIRLWHPERSAAQSQEAPILKYEATPDQAGSQREEPAADASVSNIQLTQKDQRDIGVETVEVGRRNLQRALIAVAKVDEPETQLASISARIGGRIDKLYVDFTGQQVRRGQTIASLYSPEVFSTAEEYRLALENRKRLGTGAESLAVSGAEDLVNASRRRLELWGLTTQQLDEIASSAKPQIELPIYSTVSGIVTERKVTPGQYVNAGEVLFTITDLSTIWVKADVYQPDLPSVHTGQPVEITSDSLPGTTLRGRVGFLDTSINPQTRTASARIEVPNPGMRLRPGMFVQVKFAAPAGNDVLAIPRSAVLDTGMRKFVYVSKGNGEFEGRQVQVGSAGTDYYPVLAGLKEGERIVSQGSFLIDSQTRITGGMTGLYGGSKEFDHGQAGQGQAQAPAVPQIKLSFRSDPETPRGNSDATLHVTALEASGKPVTDVQVKVTLIMPAMPAMGMGEMRATSDLAWKGSDYVGTIKVPTAGSWSVEVNASRNGQLLGSYHARLNAQ